MNKKIMIGIVIVAVVVFGIAAASSNNNQANNGTCNNVTLNVSFRDPVSMPGLINVIKSEKYYRGYDNETLKWIESLGDKYALFGENYIVIMDREDADKIPSPNGMGIADVDYYEIFSCNILENHSLGNGRHPDDVLLVGNVTYIKEDVHYYEV